MEIRRPRPLSGLTHVYNVENLHSTKRTRRAQELWVETNAWSRCQVSGHSINVHHVQFGRGNNIDSVDYDLDNLVSKFLVVGGSCLEIYDTNVMDHAEGLVEPVASVEVGRSTINHVRWYPFDNGLITMSSLAGSLQIVDGNTLQSVESFSLGARIFDQSFGMVPDSPFSTVVAIASEQGFRLFDLKSGVQIKALHENKVFTRLKWDSTRAHDIYCGGENGMFMHWDLRNFRKPVFWDLGSDQKQSVREIHCLEPSIGSLATVYTRQGNQAASLYSHFHKDWLAHINNDPVQGFSDILSTSHGYPVLLGSTGDNCLGVESFGISYGRHNVDGILGAHKLILEKPHGDSRALCHVAYVLDRHSSNIRRLVKSYDHANHSNK